MNYDELEAGRELDALVGQRVMSLPLLEYGRGMKCPECGGPVDFRLRAWCSSCQEWFYGAYRDYSGWMGAAWEVVEKLGAFTLENGGDTDREWMAGFLRHDAEGEPHWAYGTGDTAPLAIARAALKATDSTRP